MIDGLQREELNARRCEFQDAQIETDHFYVCQSCGQAVDMRRLGDVLHHEVSGHDPLPLH